MRVTITPLAGIALAIAGAGMMLLAPDAAGLPPQAKRTAALFVALLVLWATEALPLAMSALLAMALQPIFQIDTLGAAIQSFLSPGFFFVLTMFFLAQAIIETRLDKRFALWLLAKAGSSSRRVVLALMTGTAAISTIMSDVPACAIFMALAIGILEKAGAVRGTSNLGRALMIGIPFASLIGGVGTPAGSAINIIGLDMIERYGGMRVPFVSWMAIGLPMVAILTPLAWWLILYCYPPEIAEIGQTGERLGPMSAREKKLLAMLAGMILLWIASSWVRQLDVTLIAILSGVLMFLPGVDLLEWKRAERGIAWEVLLMIGGVTSMAAACVKTGLAKWLVDACLGGMRDWDAMWAVAAISGFTVVVHLVIPNNPALVAVLTPPIALLAASSGHTAVLYALPVVFTASCGFLLPIETVPLVTYSQGYYRMFDMFRPGAPLSVCWVLLMTAMMMWVAPLVGLIPR